MNTLEVFVPEISARDAQPSQIRKSGRYVALHGPQQRMVSGIERLSRHAIQGMLERDDRYLPDSFKCSRNALLWHLGEIEWPTCQRPADSDPGQQSTGSAVPATHGATRQKVRLALAFQAPAAAGCIVLRTVAAPGI